MGTDTSGADATVRAEIARAFRELRPHIIENARKDADLDPASRLSAFSDTDLEQIVNAWEAMFMEALEGRGRETRELIFETALPPILELGQTALDMARSTVISAVMLSTGCCRSSRPSTGSRPPAGSPATTAPTRTSSSSG